MPASLAAAPYAARPGEVGAATLRAKPNFAITDVQGNREQISTSAPAFTTTTTPVASAAVPQSERDDSETALASNANHRAAEPWETDVLTAREVAQLLRCNLKTVYESARAGMIPCIRLGRSFRFSRQAILASLQTCKSASRREEH